MQSAFNSYGPVVIVLIIFVVDTGDRIILVDVVHNDPTTLFRGWAAGIVHVSGEEFSAALERASKGVAANAAASVGANIVEGVWHQTTPVKR